MVKRNKTNLMETVYFLGVDISKKKFDAALTIDGKQFYEAQVENTSTAIQSFFRTLKTQVSSLSSLIVCMEHTGVYCQPLLDFLVKHKIPVCVEPALQIKQSQGMRRGKNDKVDAQRIAIYALKNQNELNFWQPARPTLQKLKALLTTRDRLIKAKTQLEVPLQECEEFIDPVIRKEMMKHCQKNILALKRGILNIEQAINELVSEDTQLRHQCDLITSVPGIGKITALNVIISTREFEKINNHKKFACYAGVAPFEHQSGSSLRGRTRVSKMANMTLKRLLHLAAMTAIQHCDELKSYYRRKVEAGKNKMSVINAVRNKLISRVFVCINQQRKYQKIYQNALA